MNWYKPPSAVNDGLIFREDFINPTLAATNGLVITGNPWVTKGVYVIDSTPIIVPSMASFASKTGTFIVDAMPTAFTGTYRSLINTRRTALVQFGYVNTSNRLFANGAALVTSTNEISLVRSLFAFVWNGSTVTFYQNGITLGSTSWIIGLGNPASDTFNLGLTRVGNGGAGQIFSVSLYNRAFTAEEVFQHYKLTRGLTE